MTEPLQTLPLLPLQCLGGRPPPAEMAADLALLPRLPAPAKLEIYRVLGPCLAEPVPGSVEPALDSFREAFQLDEGALARALRASRFLLRQAAMLDLPAGAFAEDLGRLGHGDALAAVLMPGYEAARAMVRTEITGAVLDDHGKVVERVDWRVDQVISSNRGQKLGLPVTLLTLSYREGERRDRITLQLPAEALQELKAMCARLS
jgi:hypothetical protein